MNNIQNIEAVKKSNNLTEDIHTFHMWKKLGYKIKKGEKAHYVVGLWKEGNCKTIHREDVENENDKYTSDDMYLCKAYLFTEHQVEYRISIRI